MTDRGGDLAGGEGVNRRPADVRDLMLESTPSDDWYAVSRKHNRFFVTNLGSVIDALGVDHTTSGPYFTAAEEAIKTETTWLADSGFTFSSSKTQIYPKDRGKAKLYGHAATIIVAMELYARERRPTFNVYDHLRILPAQYYVDRLDRTRLDALKANYLGLDKSTREEKFGRQAPPSFAEACIHALGQVEEALLDQLVAGHCITRHVAQALVSFVAEGFPDQLHLGPVRFAGEEPSDPRSLLGNKSAAPALRVPRRFDISQLPPVPRRKDDDIPLSDGEGGPPTEPNPQAP
jgi:hypothetical protein